MGHKVRRVPLDFQWPLNKRWDGFIRPDNLDGIPCHRCNGDGWSHRGRYLHGLWYGKVPFQPEDNGSVPFSPTMPAVWAFAERNVTRSLGFYGGTGKRVILMEATRLANLWNGMWCHHLNAHDVEALIEAGRLLDFTHVWDTETRRWMPRDLPAVPPPEDVNLWSITGFGHDSINAGVCIKARARRENVPYLCSTCQGEGDLEAYPGQRDEAENWEPTEPPEGEGWQLWETVTEGSPISPVFPTGQALARWLTTPDGAAQCNIGTPPMPYDVALAFVMEGHCFTLYTNEDGVHDGPQFVGQTALRNQEDTDGDG